MFDYGKTAATATRLIERFGAKVTLRRIGPSVYDPATGKAQAAETVLMTRGIFVDIEHFAADDATGVSMADIAMILQAAVEPAEGDRLEADGKVYSVLTSKPVSPAGLPLLYRCDLKAN